MGDLSCVGKAHEYQKKKPCGGVNISQAISEASWDLSELINENQLACPAKAHFTEYFTHHCADI